MTDECWSPPLAAVLCGPLTVEHASSSDHTTNSVTALLPLPVHRCGTVCLNSFGNRTSPLDSLNDRLKRLCLVSQVTATCVWTLRALTRNLTYLLTYCCLEYRMTSTFTVSVPVVEYMCLYYVYCCSTDVCPGGNIWNYTIAYCVLFAWQDWSVIMPLSLSMHQVRVWGVVFYVVFIESVPCVHCPLLILVAQDNVVRVWTMDSVNDNVVCIAAGYGHTHTVMSLAFFRHVSFVWLHETGLTGGICAMPSASCPVYSVIHKNCTHLYLANSG